MISYAVIVRLMSWRGVVSYEYISKCLSVGCKLQI